MEFEKLPEFIPSIRKIEKTSPTSFSCLWATKDAELTTNVKIIMRVRERRIAWQFARDLPIALVCHGAQVPAVYGLLKGRRTACFPPITGDMENAGATVVDAPDCVDGNLVSCRGWPDMPQFGRAMMEVFDKSIGDASA